MSSRSIPASSSSYPCGALPAAVDRLGRSRWSEELNKALDQDGLATHGHPRALLGSRIYAASIAWALDRAQPLSYGGLIERLLETATDWSEPADTTLFRDYPDANSWDAEWLATVDEVIHLLQLSLDGLGEGAVAVDRSTLQQLGAFGDMKGAGTVTAVAAIFLASRYASQPEQGLLAAAFARGADTDTLASLTAGLLGTLHGPGWLEPLAHGVQDAAYLERIMDDVLEERSAIGPVGGWRRAERNNLYRWLDDASVGDKTILGPFGEATIATIEDHETRTTFVCSWHLHTELGQAVRVKRYDQGKDGRPRWRAFARTEDTPSRKTKPRAGLILQVTRLDRARDFYERVVGLEVNKATKDFVSFGWLALEPVTDIPPSTQLDMAPVATSEGQAIRVYLTEEAVDHARREADSLGLETFAAPPRFNTPAFRCRDPDGHVVEFVIHNGKPPVI